ncbi:MAG: carbohydrate-binding domain-containing protein [Ruminococcus sp.]|nr:carbohydrate-binding domain-containing protein [Ruminococcus sp.]
MKKIGVILVIACMVFVMTACGDNVNEPTMEPSQTQAQTQTQTTEVALEDDGVTDILLSDSEILVEGKAVSEDSADAVYVGNDIVYYEEGKDLTYGEGTDDDAHSLSEAQEHRVVYITKAGEYRVSGKLSKGQVAVDLGEDAKKNPEAVVTLILDGADITCDVAPGVIFYNVYECGSDGADSAVKDVDTSAAGANVIIADDSENVVNGSYVAKIYKPETVVLNGDGTEVEDASKLHKYDGAFYSKMSMNINGGEKGNGVLTINADNEGLDSELHLTINGGNININSGNDGINTNEDGVSVTTINGGSLNICVNGATGEGDGIDSNGWLVINGGKLCVEACSFSADAGIDSDMGIHINGGTVFASGSMLDRIEEDSQPYVLFNLREKLTGENTLSIKSQDGEILDEITINNDCSVIIYSSSEVDDECSYSLYAGDEELAAGDGGMSGEFGMGGPGMPPPEGEPYF